MNQTFSKSRILLMALAIGAFASMQTSKADQIKLTSVGPIAFGEGGVLFVSDPMAATIYAIETGDTEGNPDKVEFLVEGIQNRIAEMLGATADQIRIQDLAISPQSGNAYLSVSRGSDAIVLKLDAGTKKISELELDSEKATSTKLPNAAESRQSRRGNPRMSSITDLAFIDGQVYVAGLSNEEFASNLRSIQYPFEKVSVGSSIEIYHGAHGQFETRSPVRTFAAYQIGGETNLLAAYTCTPLVRIPVKTLKDKEKVQGTTVAELGNRNRPLDMVVYKKNGKDYILMANSSRGVMKVDLAKVGDIEGIEERVSRGGTAGITFETIESLEGVVQLDALNKTHAVVLISKDGKSWLKSIELP